MNIREILDKLTVLSKPLSEMSWQDIYDLNKDQIKNPNLIYPNQKFKMPGGGEYVVKPGDNLSKIAKQYVAKVDTEKKEPEKSDVDKQIEKDKANPQNNPIAAQIEKDKTNPQNTPPKKDGQSGQTTPVGKPPAITIPPVKVSQSNYDSNRSVDVSEPSGFNWGNIRSKADTDYSTGDIGYKPDGSMGIRTPFKRNTQAIPQTGGSGYWGGESEIANLFKRGGDLSGLTGDTVVTPPKTGTTVTPPGTTVTPPGTTVTPPGTTVTPPGTTVTPPGTTVTPPVTPGQQPPSGTRVKPPKTNN